ncbi:YfiT family bacillithiol transferase [Reichenbachiella ulvae]|uniref:Metal-dependent hydrolase n=1 Tax=Reichenbachiella ulvae TaxID=2980104 RepID=A0ABT3CWZ4_9BACT|nr:putative metal-dependent hydrolase [Reichenbachiella ulvae]MCV9388218.1 putative metal-dependent hydrolase [Reichenbachiella ulvae]
MSESTMYSLKYPIGEFEKPAQITAEHISQWIEDIERFPIRIKELTHDLSTEQLKWPYRPRGWTIKQVVHHCADSHMNSLMRFKLALTEELPAIRPYFEDRWAELEDSLDDDLSYTQMLLEGLHYRWVKLLKSLTADDLKREFVHPEHGQQFSLAENIGIYAWHCNHHTAHVKQALELKGES